MGMRACAHGRCQHCQACDGDARAPDVWQECWKQGLRTCDRRFPMPTIMGARALWATLTPLVLASLCVLLCPMTAVADIIVHGDRTGFEQLLNDLLQGSGATVAIHRQTGMLTMQGHPTTEFGLQLREKIASSTRDGHAITDPHGRPVSIIIHAVQNQAHIAIGCFHGDGVQTIAMDDIRAFPRPGTGLPTRAAQVAHELGEVFDSVRYGRTTPLERDRHPRGQRDFDLNHYGGAHADENAVNRQEAGITRTGEGVLLQGGRRADGATTVSIREPFTRGGQPIVVETILVQRADGAMQVASVTLEAAPPAGARALVHSGRFATAEAPGRRTFNTASQSRGVLPLKKPRYLDLAFFWKLLSR